MFFPPASPWVVPFDGDFDPRAIPTGPTATEPSDKKLKKQLAELVDELADLQRRLYAEDRRSLLLVFQALDAAGKDSTIRAVFTGVNPAGFQVSSFKAPSSEELDHDFLWRSAKRLPERGRIGIFNRSYYEEVLVVRVHPGFLKGQRLPPVGSLEDLWADRFASIREHEAHLARNGTVVLKFWLRHGRDEQARRFLSRIEDPRKNWKFSSGDVRERGHWEAYLDAYGDALAHTSRPWAPWYAIPADSKPFARLQVAKIVVETMRAMDLRYPEPDPEELAKLADMKALLEGQLAGE
jgi:PPK2 family polyphosphate:nucleotide phosphotransferase